MEPVALCFTRITRDGARVWSASTAVLARQGRFSEPILWAGARAEDAGRRCMENLCRCILDPRPCEFEVNQYEVTQGVQDDVVHLQRCVHPGAAAMGEDVVQRGC